MLPELGFISLLLATMSAFLLMVIPQLGLWLKNSALISWAWKLSYSFGFFITSSISILAYSFVKDDFSLKYVASHSNSELPLWLKISATWGGHEGSMLFWLFALGIWAVIFAISNTKNKSPLNTQSLAILGWICFSFAIFILFFSNPYERIFPSPLDGQDLNPMLQDIGMIFHPPLLYLGYVGFAISFALSLASLLQHQSPNEIAHTMRTWVLSAWIFLTLGILLGAWWAYYELGWGGWWFWDPVENSSLMPWLLGLALLHTLIINSKKGVFNYWVWLLSILCFSFSVLGTFIMRSGVLTSVHAFAVDSQRGTALLIIFILLTLVALGLFAFKAHQIQPQQPKTSFKIFSSASAILWLNILLTIANLTTFLGTFYPMLFQAMHWGSISVGTPYFNSIFIPLIILMLGLMIVFTHQISQTNKIKLLIPSLILAGVLIYSFNPQDYATVFRFKAFLLISLALWMLITTLTSINWKKSPQVKSPSIGMIVAHSGVALAIVGAVISSYFINEIGVRLAPQQSQQLGEFNFTYTSFSNEIGSNFTEEVTNFVVTKNNSPYAKLQPTRRYYDRRNITMSEVGFDGDIYILIGDPKGKGEFTFRLQYKPLIRLLWLGGILMAFGGLLALITQTLERNKKQNYE